VTRSCPVVFTDRERQNGRRMILHRHNPAMASVRMEALPFVMAYSQRSA
jgi:hypothetical protein